MEKFISFFTKRHFLTNFLLVIVFIGAIFSWNNTRKEELPDVTFERIRISVNYPGAPAEDVEYFVTDPIEEAVKNVDGVYRITSNTSAGSSSVTVELEPNYTELNEALNEIRNEVSRVDLPAEIIDDPSIRVFKTSRKAIIDIAVIDTSKHLLDVEARQRLQKYALELETQLVNLAEINSVNRRNYLQEEIQIKLDPEKCIEYELPLNDIRQEISNNHIRRPAGTIENKKEPKVTLLSELKTPQELNQLIVQGGFEGGVIRLGEIAQISEGFEKNQQITKVNGSEAVFFSVVKNSSAGILKAIRATNKAVEKFRENNLKGTGIEVILMDDESVDIRNRLKIISVNGIIGFILIIAILFLFLNIRSGIWVAMGIPFTFCFTMICAYFLDYSINGITLAAVIIVMGMIVDDAIVVAENIFRLMRQGIERSRAVIEGTAYVLLPIVASILTTCIAFVPLLFFTGRYGKFVQFLPPIIFLMLGASLLESIFILPGHMDLEIPWLKKSLLKADRKPTDKHWFENVEERYRKILEKLLHYKGRVAIVFVILLAVSVSLIIFRFKFVMFPREETKEIVLAGEAPAGTTRFETAELTKKIEDILAPYVGKEVVGIRNDIARGRRGGGVEENKFRMIIEIVPKEERRKSTDQLVKEFEKKVSEEIQGFEKLSFSKSRWGQESGSAIEIFVQQNDEKLRAASVQELKTMMEASDYLVNIEIDEGLRIPEYRLNINQEKAKRLSISPTDIGSTLRAALEGAILYEFQKGDEEVDVRLTTIDSAKNNIEKVLDIPVENIGKYLVPLRDVVNVEEVKAPNNIYRRDLKRTTVVYADINKKSGNTPLEAARRLEEEIFPQLLSRYPTTTFNFGGEVQDTRESQGELISAIIMALLLIYSILAILFKSFIKPLIIMLAIPFGVVGIVLAFWLHGKTLFGFYAAIGALGLAGVVINDSIIMMVKLDDMYDNDKGKEGSDKQIADIAKTRLRAVTLTTLTTVVGLIPTAYGFAGYDAMLAEMMLALTWGLIFGTVITLILIPSVYSFEKDLRFKFGWKL